LIKKQYELEFVKVPLTYEEEEQVRKIAEDEGIMFTLAKEKFLTKKTTLQKWIP